MVYCRLMRVVIYIVVISSPEVGALSADILSGVASTVYLSDIIGNKQSLPMAQSFGVLVHLTLIIPLRGLPSSYLPIRLGRRRAEEGSSETDGGALGAEQPGQEAGRQGGGRWAGKKTEIGTIPIEARTSTRERDRRTGRLTSRREGRPVLEARPASPQAGSPAQPRPRASEESGGRGRDHPPPTTHHRACMHA